MDFFKILDLPVWQMALFVLPILPNLWCIWHAFKHDFPQPQERYLWMLGGVLVPVLGGLAYLLFGWRRSRPMVENPLCPRNPHS